jgi:hypothetical protein
MGIVGKEFHHGAVGGVNIFGIARQRHPTERPLAFTE